MHDCPTCRVPLHGHEERCPSCGTPQYVRKGKSSFFDIQKEPSVNLAPIIVTALAIGVVFLIAVQFSWIGQVMNRGPVQEDPMEKMTYSEARQIIETKITEGLTAVGAKGDFKWTSNGEEVDKNADQNVELLVATRLSDPQQRRGIIDPIKDYMEKAKIPTLTMTDSKSNATWTYTVSVPTGMPADDAGM